jgi:O-antigen/teichoic acid export membrane protein
LKSLLSNIGWLLSGRAVNALFSLAYLALATRTLSLADFGRFSLIVVLAQAVGGLASFYGWQTIVRWGAIEGEAPRVTGFAIALDLISVLSGGLLAALLVWLAPFLLPLPPDLRLTAFALCIATLLGTRSTPTGLLRLNDRYDVATLAEASLPATRAGGAIIAALAYPEIGGFVAAWAAAEIVCGASYWLSASKLQPINFRHLSLRDFPNRHPGVWTFVLSTNLSRGVAVTAKQLVLLFVGAVGGAAIAGGFRAASQLGQALLHLGDAVSRASDARS